MAEQRTRLSKRAPPDPPFTLHPGQFSTLRFPIAFSRPSFPISKAFLFFRFFILQTSSAASQFDDAAFCERHHFFFPLLPWCNSWCSTVLVQNCAGLDRPLLTIISLARLELPWIPRFSSKGPQFRFRHNTTDLAEASSIHRCRFTPFDLPSIPFSICFILGILHNLAFALVHDCLITAEADLIGCLSRFK